MNRKDLNLESSITILDNKSENIALAFNKKLVSIVNLVH